jgi:hypothetical protein
VVAALALALAPACRQAQDEASVRRREAQAIEGQLGSTRVRLYRALKTSVRSLPPRDELYRITAGREELTRDEWAALIEREPALAPYNRRVGLLVVGAQVREAAYAGALVTAAVLAASAGGRLAGDPSDNPVLQLPRTRNPFGSPVAFYRECRDILADDEDRYPTLCVSMMPGTLHRAALERRGIFATPPFDRLAMPAFEHLALGCSWLTLQPVLALYELQRARVEDLSFLEAAVLHAARAALFNQSRWYYHALDELDALEREIPKLAAVAALVERETTPEQAEALMRGLLHLMRYQTYLGLEREADAAAELGRAETCLKGQERWKALGHMLAARTLLDKGQYKPAARELRLAADALPAEPETQARLRELAERMERELPDSSAPADVLAFAVRLVSREAARLAVGDDASRGAQGFRDRAQEQLAHWERAFPSTDELREQGRAWWRRLLPGSAPPGSPSPSGS